MGSATGNSDMTHIDLSPVVSSPQKPRWPWLHLGHTEVPHLVTTGQRWNQQSPRSGSIEHVTRGTWCSYFVLSTASWSR